MRVYLAMNGSIGCLPDNSMVFRNRKAAEDSLIDLFRIARKRLAGTLRRDGIVYFPEPHEYGADYAEVAEDTMTAAEYREYENTL